MYSNILIRIRISKKENKNPPISKFLNPNLLYMKTKINETEIVKMTEERKYFTKFNAVDLMQIALFALLIRFVFFYIYKALYVVFPWNQAIFPLFQAFVLAILLVTINKGGTLTYWSAAWWLINLFLQGEDIIYAIALIPQYLIAEFVSYLLWRRGWEVSNLKSMLLVGSTYFGLNLVLGYWSLNYLFFIPFPFYEAFLPVLAIILVLSNPIGIYAGSIMGKRLKEVIG